MRKEHPIVEQALFAIAEGTALGFYSERVKVKLLEIDNGKDLQHAVITLASLAKLMESAGNTQAAEKILDLACIAIEPLHKFEGDSRLMAEDLTRAKTARFRAFGGEETKAKAPKYGAKPTTGVSLFQILPPRPRRA
jgi:hypothetical protein